MHVHIVQSFFLLWDLLEFTSPLSGTGGAEFDSFLCYITIITWLTEKQS